MIISIDKKSIDNRLDNHIDNKIYQSKGKTIIEKKFMHNTCLYGCLMRMICHDMRPSGANYRMMYADISP